MSWLLMRLLKWLALFLLMSGTIGAFTSTPLRDRQRAAYWLMTPGFILTWVFGYTMAETRGISLGSTWITLSMVLSLGSLALTVWSVERERRGRAVVATIAIGALIVSTATMVYKTGGTRTKPAETTEASP